MCFVSSASDMFFSCAQIRGLISVLLRTSIFRRVRQYFFVEERNVVDCAFICSHFRRLAVKEHVDAAVASDPNGRQNGSFAGHYQGARARYAPQAG